MPGERLYTKEQLIACAKDRRVSVTSAQFDDWKGHGLLPESVPESSAPGAGREPVRRGRPRLLYPEPTPAVVVWLGEHRKYIDGDDVAAVWLWLEFGHVKLDPLIYLLAAIKSAWDDLRTSIPSLPNIAHAVEHGLSDDQVNRILDEWDAAITAPALDSGELDERTAPQVYLDALMYGVVPPEWIDPADGDMQPYAAAMYDLPPDDPRVVAVARQLPHRVRAASLVTLYRRLFAEAEWERVREYLITHYHELAPEVTEQLSARYNQLLAVAVGPSWLRMWWRFLTPEIIGTYWRGGAGGVPRLRSRGELLRYWKYDPLQFAMFAANVEDTLKRGAGPFKFIPLLKQERADSPTPQASQPPQEGVIPTT